jgi:5-oxoprolinase (ATP-hydrolysing)
MRWRLFVDTGGTFTDCVAIDPRGATHTAKVLSHSALRSRIVSRDGRGGVTLEHLPPVPEGFFAGFRLRILGAGEGGVEVRHNRGTTLELAAGAPAGPGAACEVVCSEPAPILAARLVTGTPADRPLPPLDMRLGTTRGTNALLEGRGAPVALFTTIGLGDLIEIGDQRRPDLFAIHVIKRRLRPQRVIEVRERLAADGSVIVPLEADHLDELERVAASLVAEGVETAAVALLHAYRVPAHEQAVAARLRRGGLHHVVCAAELSPTIKILPRAQAAVVDAYLGPVVAGHLERVAAALGPQGRLQVMTSAGGVVGAGRFRASDSLLSGPAGGVCGIAAVARRTGLASVIGFDMGGTSTDVARFGGDFEYRYEQVVADAAVALPGLAIETVAAGGGSICALHDGRLAVGPRSAGAQPGPACYGAGGPLTLTDVNLLLGRLDAGDFEIPIERAAAEAALDELRAALRATGQEVEREPLLEGLVQMANERMAAAIRQISVARGEAPGESTLVAFGGAGGQHACAVAAAVGMSRVLFPAGASLLCALGLRHATVERIATRQVLQPLVAARSRLAGWFEALVEEAGAEVRREGVDRVVVRRRIMHLRLAGQEAALEIDADAEPEAAFAAAYRATYGHEPAARPIEVESIRVVVSSLPVAVSPVEPPRSRHAAPPVRTGRGWFGGAWCQLPVQRRADLRPGAVIEGPALVCEPRTTLVIDPGWVAVMDEAGAIRCEAVAAEEPRRDGGGLDAVELALFTGRFQGLVEEAGRQMERTALSTNVKERLDFSVGLLDAKGRLVCNAPHIPVHLGALGMCVRAVAAAIEMGPGDVVVTNHPAFGGSHLPDITVITPVFSPERPRHLLGHMACRAHHAEIGGTRPGSMPPDARTLAEEGVVLAPTHLVRGGRSCEEQVAGLLRGGRYPSRAVADNLADLRAAVAANERGAAELRRLARRFGDDALALHMDQMRAQASRLTSRALRRRVKDRLTARERLDDGSEIAVSIGAEGERVVVDFGGSAPVHPGNLNATPAIVGSAVMYVLRLLVGREGAAPPLNDGMLEAVRVRLEPGMLDPPLAGDPRGLPAVVGGNVETSQRVVDALIKALELGACSQGTMNNLLFGDEGFAYYETICGGAGASTAGPGADAVHTHMTNTRLTDPEILELRYPVRIERFAVRWGSGGRGRFKGGAGVVRELRFLRALDVSVLAQHRVERPFGMAGGEPGAAGRQFLIRCDGRREELPGSAACRVEPGDRLVIETPGGGGFGPAEAPAG